MSALVSQEIQLAKVETKEEVNRAAKAAELLGAAGLSLTWPGCSCRWGSVGCSTSG